MKNSYIKTPDFLNRLILNLEKFVCVCLLVKIPELILKIQNRNMITLNWLEPFFLILLRYFFAFLMRSIIANIVYGSYEHPLILKSCEKWL